MSNPFLIYVPIYYGEDLNPVTIGGLESAASSMNSQPAMLIDGKYYEVMIAPIAYATTAEAMSAAGVITESSSYGYNAGFIDEGDLGVNASNEPRLGEAGEVKMTVDVDNVLENMASSAGMSRVVGHELGHLLGFSSSDGHSSSTGSLMTSSINGNSNGILTNSDWANIITSRGW